MAKGSCLVWLYCIFPLCTSRRLFLWRYRTHLFLPWCNRSRFFLMSYRMPLTYLCSWHVFLCVDFVLLRICCLVLLHFLNWCGKILCLIFHQFILALCVTWVALLVINNFESSVGLNIGIYSCRKQCTVTKCTLSLFI